MRTTSKQFGNNVTVIPIHTGGDKKDKKGKDKKLAKDKAGKKPTKINRISKAFSGAFSYAFVET